MQPSTRHRWTALVLIPLFLCACNDHSVKFKATPLPIALLNQAYSYKLSVPDSDGDLQGLNILSDNLPNELTITNNGALSASAEETGLYNFEIEALYVQEWGPAEIIGAVFLIGLFIILASGCDDCGDDDYDDDDYEETEQQDTVFDFFVTEPSTNASCPLPDDQDTSEIWFCLGEIQTENTHADTKLGLDINYFIPLETAPNNFVDEITLTVSYDPEFFYIDEETLTPDILRESALAAEADITSTIDTDVGSVTITLSSIEKYFSYSGRLIDLPIYPVQDLPAGEYPFEIVIDSIESAKDKVILPEVETADGTVTAY